jgi:hypothetical protein
VSGFVVSSGWNVNVGGGLDDWRAGLKGRIAAGLGYMDAGRTKAGWA